MGDSNPRARKGKRFSRPPRYDHFDNPPYHLTLLYYHILLGLSSGFSNLKYKKYVPTLAGGLLCFMPAELLSDVRLRRLFRPRWELELCRLHWQRDCER